MKRRYNRQRSPFVLFAVLTVLMGISSQAVIVRAAPTMSLEREISIGKKAAADLERKNGGVLLPAHPQSQRVRRIGQEVAVFSTRKNVPYSYQVLATTKNVNAMAAPGGPIYVTQGLLKLIANDAELAYILGHEIAHIERRHMVQSIEKREKAQQTTSRVAEQVLGKGKSKGLALATDVTFFIWSRGYSRDNESEADKWSVRHISRLGYDPQAALSITDKLSGDKKEPGQLEKYLASHPMPAQRIEALRELIRKENLVAVAQQHGGPNLWSNDDPFPTREEELARRSHEKPEPAAPASTRMERPAPKPPVKPGRETVPTQKSSAPQLPVVKAPKPQASPSPVVWQQTEVPDLADSQRASFPLAIPFVGLAVVLFGGAVYFWFNTQSPAFVASTPRQAAAGVRSIRFSTPGNWQHSFDLQPSGSILLGRDSRSALSLQDGEVSATHARISYDGRHFQLLDCSSRNGTWLNGKRIVSAYLCNGDEIRLGQTTLTVTFLSLAGESG